MSPRHVLKHLLPSRYRQQLRRYLVSRSVRHLSGPRQLALSRGEAVVTCVVKNGEFYVQNFIEHYSRMGFRHIFFLDNGSSDQTIPIAQRYQNVSICTSSLPIEAHQRLFKSYLARTSCAGGWCLDADIDEFFDYPYSGVLKLSEFLEYLNQSRATAVMTQLLDMFSDKSLSELGAVQDDVLSEAYQYYDLSNLTRTPYRGADLVAEYAYGNEVTSEQAALYFGGIRKTLYGNHCLLTKHSLFFPGRQMELFPHAHFVNHARLADVSCIMRHYKLTSTALDCALQNAEGFAGNSAGYRNFITFLENQSDCRIKKETAVRYRNAEALAESGFLFMSDQYQEFVHSRCAAVEAPTC